MEHPRKGEISLAALTGVAAFVVAIAAPVLYVGDIKEKNAVQEAKIENIQINITELRADNRELIKKVDSLLINRGINPDKVVASSPNAP